MNAILLIITLLPFIKNSQAQQLGKDGDFIIGLILPIHDTNDTMVVPYDTRFSCGFLNSENALRISYFRRMIDAANANSTDFKIGYNIVDSCNIPAVAMARTFNWTRSGQRNSGQNNVLLTMGAYTSRVSIPMATYLQLYDIPMLGFGSTSSELSSRIRYPLYLRTCPSDRHLAEAMVEIASKHFKFQCVHLIFSDGIYGELGADDVRASAAKAGLCIATDQRAPLLTNDATDSDFQRVVANIHKKPNVSAVICFCEDSTILGLLTALRAARSSFPNNRFILIGTDFWGNSLEIPEDLNGIAESAVTLALDSGPELLGSSSKSGKDSEWLNQQVANMKNQDPWFKEFLENRFHCSLDNGSTTKLRPCEENEVHFKGSQQLQDRATAYQFQLAFEAIVNGLRSMIEQECAQKNLSKSDCVNVVYSNAQRFYSYMKNSTFPIKNSGNTTMFKFDANGEGQPYYKVFNYRRKGFGPFYMNRYVYQQIGDWSGEKGFSPSGSISSSLGSLRQYISTEKNCR